MKKIMCYSIILVLVLCIFSASIAAAIASDDFDSSTLNESLWTIIDPRNDAIFSMVNTGSPYASFGITIPGGISHDVSDRNWAPRIMQTADNSDFEVEVKFQSLMNKTFQMQGIIIEQDELNFLRFDFHSKGQKNWVLSANFTNGSLSQINNREIGAFSHSTIPLYMRVKRAGNHWTQKYSFDGMHWIEHASFDRTLTVTSIGPFVGNADGTLSGTSSPAFTGLIDYFFNTSSPIVPEDMADTIAPKITVWYGNSQSFGQIGVPQQWVNILGNVYDESGVTSLNYSLNSGTDQVLSIGPDIRLESSGDFNVEINHTDLKCGVNRLVIKAADAQGNSKNEIVSVNYSCNNTWPKNYIINWSKTTSIQDAAQIVDGLWIKEANSIRPGIIGYDRMIAIGDMTWDDYEITVPIVINTPLDSSLTIKPNFGFITRWQGHWDWDITKPISWFNKQPRPTWYPLGALGVYIWVPSLNDYRLRIIGNNMNVIANDMSGKHLDVGVPYMFKMRAQTIGTKTRYSLKVWQQNMTEPAGWTISGDGVAGELKQGSVTLNAHNSDVSFGNVTVRPGPFVPDTQPVPKRSTISGYKINDTNGDGKWNSGEQGIANWRISLKNATTGTEIAITTTDNSGFYRFANLLNGTYNVTEEAKIGFKATNSTFLLITLLGKDVTNQNFTNQLVITEPVARRFSISGYKINDTNGDGKWNSGEQGIANWKISLKNATTGSEITTTMTDNSGFYRFANLLNGTYNVTEEAKIGFKATNSTFLLITLLGKDVTNQNFTNQLVIIEPVARRFSISGYKINDTNGDGKWNTREQGIANWKISLINPKTGKEITNTPTNVSGFYKFSNLPNGKYKVIEESRPGFIATKSTFLLITISGKDVTNQNFMNQPVPSIIKAKVEIKPETLNLASKGEFTAFITLPDNFDEQKINPATLMCNGAQAIKGKFSKEDKGTFIAKFNIRDLKDIQAAKEVKLKVSGEVDVNGVPVYFEGSDTIRIIKKGKETNEKDIEKDDNEKDKDIKKGS